MIVNRLLGNLVRRIATSQNQKTKAHDDVNSIAGAQINQIDESSLALPFRLANQKNGQSMRVNDEKIAVRPNTSKPLFYGGRQGITIIGSMDEKKPAEAG